jgi:S-adenosylmethionine:tRNA ribosyltransferase-isomerase
MQLTDFDYQLPKDLIAQYPLEQRSASRLLDVMVQVPSHEVLCKDLIFTDIVQLLQKGDLLIFNDTKVIPARVFGTKDTGGKVELLIERVLPQNCVLAQIKASKPPKPGSLIYVGSPDNQVCLQVLSRHQNANQSELTPS